MADALRQSLVYRGVRRVSKNLWQEFAPKRIQGKEIIVILGCQRSGTTAMMHGLDRSLWVRQYNEVTRHARRSSDGLSWAGGVEAMTDVFGRARAPLVVAKPLADSCSVAALLDADENLDVLWMYRSVDDVVRSNLQKFGTSNGWRNLAPLLAGDFEDWRAKGAADHVVRTIRDLVRGDLSPEDAQALFWWSRNNIPFDASVIEHPRFWLIDYDDWTADPYGSLGDLWAKVPNGVIDERTFVGIRRSGESGKTLDLSPRVRSLCEALMERMRTSSTN